MAFIKLFAGLGNPGEEYKNTRHNFGFMVLDAIAQSKNIKFKSWNNMADISFYDAPQGKVRLIKPMTFMNLSGTAVGAFAGYYKIEPEEICVFYDDFSIPLGEYRIRLNGCAGGHNGISSIIEHLGASFPRMKLGIGRAPQFIKTADFVLSKFKEEDKEKVDAVKLKAVEFFDKINILGFEKAVSKMH